MYLSESEDEDGELEVKDPVDDGSELGEEFHGDGNQGPSAWTLGREDGCFCCSGVNSSRERER